MADILVNDKIADALTRLDKAAPADRNAALISLGRVLDDARKAGCTYADVVLRIARLRPRLSEEDVEALMYDVDAAESEG